MLLELVGEFKSCRGEILYLFAKIKKDQLLRAPINSVGWQGGDTEYPLAGLPISVVLGDYSLWPSEDVGEKQLYYSQSRDGIWRCGLSPVSFHDNLEYKTPS